MAANAIGVNVALISFIFHCPFIWPHHYWNPTSILHQTMIGKVESHLISLKQEERPKKFKIMRSTFFLQLQKFIDIGKE
jgi:hypothetical protein